MKRFARFSILLMFVILSISVFAVNNDVEREVAFDPAHPEAGKYRVAYESHMFKSAYSSTHAKVVAVAPPIYPQVRISYSASAGVSSWHLVNRGSYEFKTSIPTRGHTNFPIDYRGEFSDSHTSSNVVNTWMGTPDIDECSANAKISDSGNSSETEIPFP